MKIVKTVLIFFVFIFTSCINEWDKYLETKEIEYNLIQASESFKQNSKLHLETYKNNLTVRLHVKPLIKHDSLRESKIYSSFYFEFYNNNQIIKVDSLFTEHLYKTIQVEDSELKYISKGYNLHATNDVVFTIPLLYFYNLKKGESKIKLKIYTSNKALLKPKDKNLQSKTIKINNEFSNTVEFDLDIPQIYKTTVCNDSIVLQNDKDFSPKGMDVSLRDGLPDIYWRFLYYSENDSYYQGFHSPNEATYDVMYTYKDTVSFYHFEENPSNIEIEVMDRDDLSPDDIIGIWKGDIEDLKTENYKRLNFKHVDLFKIKVLKEGVEVN